MQWFLTFLVKQSSNKTFQRLEKPLSINLGSVYFTGNFGYQSSKIVICGIGNIPQRFPYCESRTTGTENDYATTIFQTSVTGIFGEIDTSINLIYQC